jgi:hypothetical protein
VNRLDLRSKAPKIVACAFIAIFLLVAPYFGSLLRRGTPPGTERSAKGDQDQAALYTLNSARESEAEGDVKEAEKGFSEVLKSTNESIRRSSAEELARLSATRGRLGWRYWILADVSERSVRWRTAILGIASVFCACWFAVVLFPRRGTWVASFPVYGCDDATANKLFSDAVVLFANQIKRSYGSDFANTVGIVLFFDNLRGQSLEDKSALDQALSDAKPEPKALFGIALSRVLRFVKNGAERPAVVLEGDVYMFPGGAKATAVIKDQRQGTETHIEAHTSEIDDLPELVHRRLLSLPARRAHSSPSKREEERREMCSQLYALALLLACKLRFSQAIKAGYVPGSWKTVCLFAAAATTFESIENG